MSMQTHTTLRILQLIVHVVIMLATFRKRFIDLHYTLNWQQQNASPTRTTDLELEYLTWYGVVCSAHAQICLYAGTSKFVIDRPLSCQRKWLLTQALAPMLLRHTMSSSQGRWAQQVTYKVRKYQTIRGH